MAKKRCYIVKWGNGYAAGFDIGLNQLWNCKENNLFQNVLLHQVSIYQVITPEQFEKTRYELRRSLNYDIPLFKNTSYGETCQLKDRFYVWHWYQWEFGYWEIAFHGTEEECKKWAKENEGEWIISKTKPKKKGVSRKDYYTIR